MLVGRLRVNSLKYANCKNFKDCTHTKFGYILNRKANNVVQKVSSSECANSCKQHSCNFWSFEGKYMDTMYFYLYGI